ncbi:MAG TPA: 23S rRNA (pseudouridine(1915)-N(3))-methyltransferase RlmH [Solirubrobacterales bacterium]|nr:23S rRNA (pseudouridine(1915)-N(3))-methyltransferase RlmH [Solirubrobacterales bacterium]
MKTTLLTVGRARSPFADAEAHYRKMLGRYLPVEVIEARDDGDLERRLPRGSLVVALDRGGRSMDSLEWSRWLQRRRLEARDLCLVVGGPAGIPEPLLARADQRISLGRQTMAHQLARVVLLEQLFRAAKILAGEPYHL